MKGENQNDYVAYLQLWLVVRVGQLGVEEELEVGAVLHLLVAQLDGATLLDEQPAEEGVQHGLDLLVQILDQKGLALQLRYLSMNYLMMID